MILTDEFARQASMEQDLGIPSALYAAPVREIVELGKSQLSFMNIFAIPLFAGVADVMPAMQYTVDELHMNKSAWEAKIEEEQTKSRSESDDLRMMDGMFSPRSMSLATPSDASQRLNSVSSTARSTSESDQLRIKAMLSKSPFSPLNGTLEEYAEPHDHPLPELSTTSPTDSQPSPSDVHFHSPSKSTHLPTQLQISSGTASAPGLLDHPSKDPDFLLNGDPAGHVNGIEVEPSLVTDAVVVPPAIKTSEKQRSSDTTNASAENWAEEATSATSGKMPLSPSTQGTSIMSDDSVEKSSTPTAGSPSASRSREEEGNEEVRGRKEEGKGVLMETVRNLRKKPSRFRMNSLNFWRRSKSASPPIPTGLEGGRRGVGSEDEGGGAYY
jgi:3',5'-cyclic-nucleotide phosphodiesterase